MDEEDEDVKPRKTTDSNKAAVSGSANSTVKIAFEDKGKADKEAEIEDTDTEEGAKA